eukprot:2941763-Pyramimonas_sp.AAC.1
MSQRFTSQVKPKKIWTKRQRAQRKGDHTRGHVTLRDPETHHPQSLWSRTVTSILLRRLGPTFSSLYIDD